MYPTNFAQFDALLGFPNLMPVTHFVNTAVTTIHSKGFSPLKTWYLEPRSLMTMLSGVCGTTVRALVLHC